jgi:hypothetical protein
MSAGTANPTTCPRCRGPLAYGQAGATRIFCARISVNSQLLLERRSSGDDTRRSPGGSPPDWHQGRGDQRSDEGNQRDRNAAQLRTSPVRREGRSDVSVDVVAFAADHATRSALRGLLH